MLQDELREHVQALAGDIGERNAYRYDALRMAADYVADHWRAMGYEVARQSYPIEGRPYDNLAVEVPGRDEPGRIVLLGAHYDSVIDCPGANDNATGVAALLALSRRFRDRPGRGTLRFVAFVNEEPPFFQTDEMGSLIYAKQCRQRNDDIAAMIALDGLGCFHDGPNTQRYPIPVAGLYPSTGNFIGFVSNLGSRSLLNRALAAYRQHAEVPAQGAALPAAIPGVGFSDHWSFWQAGYSALLVTDTLPFRYEHYHTPADTPDKIDARRFTAVVSGLETVLAALADAV